MSLRPFVTALLPFVSIALAAGSVASIVGADQAATLVWSIASTVVAVELVVVTVGRGSGRVASRWTWWRSWPCWERSRWARHSLG